jgi:hypothetical protein
MVFLSIGRTILEKKMPRVDPLPPGKFLDLCMSCIYTVHIYSLLLRYFCFICMTWIHIYIFCISVFRIKSIEMKFTECFFFLYSYFFKMIFSPYGGSYLVHVYHGYWKLNLLDFMKFKFRLSTRNKSILKKTNMTFQWAAWNWGDFMYRVGAYFFLRLTSLML